jgi:hypothetical protein
MSEVARVKVLEDVLEERERQVETWAGKRYGYEELIRLAAVCFAWAEEYLEATQEALKKHESYC